MSEYVLADIVDKLTEQLHPQLIKAVQGASEARAAAGQYAKDASVVDGPEELHEALIGSRAQIERLEYYVSQLVLLKAKTAQAVADRRGEYDDAYMKAATAKSVGFADYASAKEKDANFNLHTISETMKLRKAEKVHRDVDSAWDYCRILLRGAEGVHRDLEIRIRLISLSGQLDR